MYPTKALSQDQLRSIKDLTRAAFLPPLAQDLDQLDFDMHPLSHKLETLVQVYDGDTRQHDRPAIRDTAQLLITNPDMLNLSVLPVHSAFKRILTNLK